MPLSTLTAFWPVSSREKWGSVAVFYCKCGERKRFWAEFWWKPDEGKHGWLYFDDNKEGGSYGESVTHCSGCGEQLHRGTLTPT